VTPEQASHELRDVIVHLPGKFMTDPATYARGAELGFEGMDFYIAGRAGALGEVHADVVTAALVFFAPDAVRAAWERSATVMSRAEAARTWAAISHEWARANLTDDVDWSTVATLLRRVTAHAALAAAPLFAAWRTLPEPGDDKALALHRLYACRELRGALHGAAVLTVGLAPVEAVAVGSPTMLPVFGWVDAPSDPKPFHDRWGLAEARTDRMFGRQLTALDEHERVTLVELLQKANG
jgi:hypothetical protein